MSEGFVKKDKERFSKIRDKFFEYEEIENPKGLWYIQDGYTEELSPIIIEEIWEPDVKKNDLFWIPEAGDQNESILEATTPSVIERSK